MLKLVASAVAKVLKSNGSRKWATAEAEQAQSLIVDQCVADPKLMPELKPAILRLGNISACRQEFEKGGLLPRSDSEDSALVREVKAAMAELAQASLTTPAKK